jgi:hypothetical protein
LVIVGCTSHCCTNAAIDDRESSLEPMLRFEMFPLFACELLAMSPRKHQGTIPRCFIKIYCMHNMQFGSLLLCES